MKQGHGLATRGMRECKGGRAALGVGEMSSRQVEQYDQRSVYRGLAATADKYIYRGCDVKVSMT